MKTRCDISTNKTFCPHKMKGVHLVNKFIQILTISLFVKQVFHLKLPISIENLYFMKNSLSKCDTFLKLMPSENN